MDEVDEMDEMDRSTQLIPSTRPLSTPSRPLNS